MFPAVLTEGYRSFLGERLPQERKKYQRLAEGQDPDVLLIGCCDSRVAPEVIFDVGPGEIFTIRNVANIVPPFEEGGGYHGTSSAIEFAVQGLNVKHIVVLGHATCGGIKAYAKGAKPLSPGDFIGKWVSLVEPAAKALEARGDSADAPDYLTRLEFASIAQSLENLLTFGFVRERVERGDLHLHGAHFGIEKGELLIRNPGTGEFQSVVERDGKSLRPSALIGCSEP
ncbi:carbonic anhydrase [Methylobacterium sp. C25]|uniref:carbonic anhydrase n=1 Tax=Methylobacterium sp. C25 TaxID=2721622 RepID=UPI001F425D66|nr:carbonic anhydrase [Methylobacterium sp. C25]MCE4222538.1 carbonic anhydrase [Methylobacterium sp. C25]